MQLKFPTQIIFLQNPRGANDGIHIDVIQDKGLKIQKQEIY